MPPHDSLKQIIQKGINSLNATQPKVDSLAHHSFLSSAWDWLKNETFTNKVQAIASLIAILSALYFIIKKSIPFFKHSTELIGSLERPLKDYEKFFVPNHYKIFEASEDIEIEKKENIIIDFLETFLKDQHKIYLVVAPTGVGKTTFLANLFLEYKSKSKWSNTPRMVFSRMHQSDLITELEIIKEKKLENKTILLLDALDEFYITKNDIEDTKGYILAFNKKLDNYFEKYNLYVYKKIVITVRQQFLDEFLDDNLLSKHNNDQIIDRKIVLLPFVDDNEKETYIEKRYKVENWHALKSLAKTIQKSSPEIISIPLVLNFLEDIKVGLPSRTILYNNYNIFNAIIEQWLKRETQKAKGNKVEFKKNLQLFCHKISLKLTDENYYNGIPEKQLKAFETDEKVLEQFLGLSDRSLLTTKDGGLFTFIHRIFQDFFLASYAMEDENIEKSINWQQHPDALEILIIQRWLKLKQNIPKVNPTKQYTTEDTTILMLDAMEDWVEFIETLTINEQARKLLQTGNKLSKIIKKAEGSEWQEYFNPIKDFTIITTAYDKVFLNSESPIKNNFWDYGNNKPYETSLKFISYFGRFAHTIQIENLPLNSSAQPIDFSLFNNIIKAKNLILRNCGLVEDNLIFLANTSLSVRLLILDDNPALQGKGLEIFEGAANIRELGLHNTGLATEGLLHFRASAKNIEVLYLDNNSGLEGKGLEIFEGAANIRELGLHNTGLATEGLLHFRASAKNIRLLNLNNNSGLEGKGLEIFEGAANIRKLGLSNTGLATEGLLHFRASAKNIQVLYLGNNSGLEGKGLEIFEGAANIRELGLSNTGLAAEGLLHFRASAKNIQVLDLNNNSGLEGKGLEIFQGAANIRELLVQNTGLATEGLLHFRASAKNIEVLYLDNNSGLEGKGLEIFEGAANIRE